MWTSILLVQVSPPTPTHGGIPHVGGEKSRGGGNNEKVVVFSKNWLQIFHRHISEFNDPCAVPESRRIFGQNLPKFYCEYFQRKLSKIYCITSSKVYLQQAFWRALNSTRSVR